MPEIESKLIFNETKSYILNQYDSILCMNQDDITHYKIQSKQDFKIWFCWWQGINNSPLIVQKCYKRLLKCASDYEVVVIDKDNFRSFVEIPNYIIEKFYNNKLIIQHFCDIIRANLLLKYGGLWSDASVFYTDLFSNHNEIFEKDFFSLGTFVTYIQGTSIVGNILYKIIQDIFFDYLKTKDNFPIYLFMDAIYQCIYSRNEYVKSLIQSCSNNLHVYRHYFRTHGNKILPQDEFNNALKNTFASKLSYRDAISSNKMSALNILFDNDLYSNNVVIYCGNSKN